MRSGSSDRAEPSWSCRATACEAESGQLSLPMRLHSVVYECCRGRRQVVSACAGAE